MLSKLCMNQISTRHYVTVVNSHANKFARHAQPPDVSLIHWRDDREREISKLPRTPRSLGRFAVTQKCAILTRKIRKFSPQRCPTRIFPWAPLWLSTSPVLDVLRFNSLNGLIILGNDCSYTIDVYAFSKYPTCRPVVC